MYFEKENREILYLFESGKLFSILTGETRGKIIAVFSFFPFQCHVIPARINMSGDLGNVDEHA